VLAGTSPAEEVESRLLRHARLAIGVPPAAGT
jgi:hypothetical protein